MILKKFKSEDKSVFYTEKYKWMFKEVTLFCVFKSNKGREI